MKLAAYFGIGAAVLLGGFFLFRPHSFRVNLAGQTAQVSGVVATSSEAGPADAEGGSVPVQQVPKSSGDLPPQPQLQNPPVVVKGIYVTSWVAGSEKRMDQIIALIKRTELNAVVVDVKDYSGYVSYAMDIPAVKSSGAEGDLRISHPNALIKKLHDAGIYAIARVTVFQDPILAKAHPEWALKNKTTGKTWTDNKGLAWMDPAGQGARDYVISIAKDAINRGFDEVNFDYIRFASDGAIGNISYPFWDMKSSRSSVIANFFAYLRNQMGSAKISADLFGLATVNRDDLGIGQVIENAYKYFDYVSPMVYPSHYAPGFLGYKKPAVYPYEVMKYSLDHALVRWNALSAGTTSTPGIAPEKLGKLRPWIQDFDLGAVYTASMVRSEYKAVYDSLDGATTTDAAYAGWLVWDPANTYTEGAFLPKGN